MSRMQRQVREFHQALDLPARDIPTELPEVERRLRANLIMEETEEVLGALGFGITDYDLYPRLHPEPLHHQIKELSDLLYVVFGTAVQMGVDLGEFFELVHANNMTKVGGEMRADGKRMKPEGYRPVNLAPLLNRILEAKCPTCDMGEGPPHFASQACESGRRNHCSCDTCF